MKETTDDIASRRPMAVLGARITGGDTLPTVVFFMTHISQRTAFGDQHGATAKPG